MAHLLDLALQFQQELDGDLAPGGQALQGAVRALCPIAFPDATVKYAAFRLLEPLILQTTLATSIVAYFERIPWAEVTPQMLAKPGGTPLAAVHTCAYLINNLQRIAMGAAEKTDGRFEVVTLLLRQV